MDRKKLRKLIVELAQLRRSPQTAAILEGFAARVGRQRKKGSTRHPMWESQFDHLHAASIPHHAGRVFAPKTQKIILNQLGDDLLFWDEILPAEGEEEDGV